MSKEATGGVAIEGNLWPETLCVVFPHLQYNLTPVPVCHYFYEYQLFDLLFFSENHYFSIIDLKF